MTSSFEQGSFRDRRARVFRDNGSIYRCLDKTAWWNWTLLKDTSFFRELIDDGAIPVTHEASSTYLKQVPEFGRWYGVLQHQPVPAVTYPYEWSFSRLKDAALFHLDLMGRVLADDWIIKDSSPFNIQWKGCRPIFIDIPSFEPLAPGEPWIGYRQFCEMFLNPLMLSAYKGVRFQPWLRGRIDGIELDQMARLLTWRDMLFRRGAFIEVYLQAKMQRAMAGSKSISKESLRKAGFSKDIIIANLKRIRRIVHGMVPAQCASAWVDYASMHSYSDPDYQIKQTFVSEVAASRRWKTVWDLGCNTGDFSRLVAPHAELVLAMDVDEASVERLYLRTRAEGTENLLAILFDIADPSPSLGWRRRERTALENRRPPDLVLALALMHHLAIGANIPLRDFVEWLASLKAAIVLEFVSKDDEMAQALLRNKPDIYADYSDDSLRELLRPHFHIQRTQPLKNGLRMLYHLEPVS
jgi:hypothetical protein